MSTRLMHIITGTNIIMRITTNITILMRTITRSIP